MPRFLTIGYGDEDGYERTPEPVRDAAHAHDTKMVERGTIMGIAGKPVQVRNPNDTGMTTTPGPFLQSDLPIAGFGMLEAASLDEAILLASKSPCAVAHGVIEVWPMETPKAP